MRSTARRRSPPEIHAVWVVRRGLEDTAPEGERFVQYDDGHAAERVVRRVFLGEEMNPDAGDTRASREEQPRYCHGG
ncbi:hypothetical protein [Streptomyces chryseus]|uniref:hypothetical protein n=1 Tax=Streptomyces chryseus TaxID=68186 RepID=UPI00110FDCEF|nr:hypothetical protein [Streptomyces chryseus]